MEHILFPKWTKNIDFYFPLLKPFVQLIYLYAIEGVAKLLIVTSAKVDMWVNLRVGILAATDNRPMSTVLCCSNNYTIMGFYGNSCVILNNSSSCHRSYRKLDNAKQYCLFSKVFLIRFLIPCTCWKKLWFLQKSNWCSGIILLAFMWLHRVGYLKVLI